MAAVLRGRVVTPEAVIDDGVAIFERGRIAWVGAVTAARSTPWSPAVQAAGVPPVGTTVLPGLVDLHNHGGGGASFPDAGDVETARRAIAEHRRHGTTRLVASLVTAAPGVLLERVALLAELADAGEIAGIHLEGPFLAAARCGAQDPAHIIDGDAGLTGALLEAARGHLATMTLAPESPGVCGAGGVIETLIRGGAVPSFGHTDASSEQLRAALEEAAALLGAAETRPRSGRATITHLFNGMRPLHHREPGPIPPALAAARAGTLVLELVADGTHLAPDLVRDMFALIGAEHLALVSDAMAAAGMPDGDYPLGALDVTVRDGVARLAEGGAIAGGTAHLLDVVRAAVQAGVPLPEAVRAASLTPAGVIGAGEVGALRAGYVADAVVTDAHLNVRTVWRDGVEIPGAGAER